MNQLGSFVDENLKSHVTDLLYSVKYAGEDAYIYILAEHYTNPHRFTPIFILSYLCQIAKRLLIEKKHENKKLPCILPLVFYHGKRSPYPYSTQLLECFDDPEFAKQYFLKGFHLVDITQISDEEIKQHKTAALMEILQKYCYARDLMSLLKTLKPLFEYLAQVGADHQVVYNIKYILEIMDARNTDQAVQEISALLPDQLRGDIMTIAEQFRQQGIEQGIEQGIKQAVIGFLKVGASEAMISQATGLSLARIKKLKKEIQKKVIP